MKFFTTFNISTLKQMTKACQRFLHSRISEDFKPIIQKCLQFPDNIAVIDNHGAFKYTDLIRISSAIAKRINESIHKQEKLGRISFACSNNATYITVLFGCWLSGKIAVPLSVNHPPPVLEYYIKDSQSSLVISDNAKSSEMHSLAKKMDIPFLLVDHPSNMKEAKNEVCLDFIDDIKDDGAVIIYTSGTTGQPKGVLLTHSNFDAQVTALLQAWGWSSKDVILHSLPLYHVHGLMNALLCPLSIGATVVMRPKFNSSEVWEYLLNSGNQSPRINQFFGVPTMYVKLIKELEMWPEDKKSNIKDICLENIRLMTSGSAPLPESVFEQWENITGHRILERYGMSEIGMALSNPLNGTRKPGYVGNPLPGVEVCIVDMDDFGGDNKYLVHGKHEEITLAPGYEGAPGELLVRGLNVFKEYWNKPEQTNDAFTDDGWFKTGDTAAYENGTFKILGRTSLDVIKSSGYKISALYVESRLLMHPEILDCAVFGIPDEERGEKVAVVFSCKNKFSSPMQLKAWCSKYMPSYTIPSVYILVDHIPRNALGKVNKKELKAHFFP